MKRLESNKRRPHRCSVSSGNNVAQRQPLRSSRQFLQCWIFHVAFGGIIIRSGESALLNFSLFGSWLMYTLMHRKHRAHVGPCIQMSAEHNEHLHHSRLLILESVKVFCFLSLAVSLLNLYLQVLCYQIDRITFARMAQPRRLTLIVMFLFSSGT